MWFVWGTVSGERDLGVVAELCPRCGRVAPCRVSAVVAGMHVFFIPLEASSSQGICTCALCSGQFVCETWRYREMVPVTEALRLSPERLLELTNPDLKIRLEWSERLAEFAHDPRFETTLRSLEAMQAGALGKRLRADLQRWGSLDEGRREDLVRSVDESARTIQFARSIASQIPSAAGCSIALLVSLITWAVGFLLPDFGLTGVWRIIGIVFAGFMAAVPAYQYVQARQVSRWTNDVLVPEGRKLGIDFHHLVAILDEMPPPSPRSKDVICRLQEQLETIRKTLSLSESKPSVAMDLDV